VSPSPPPPPLPPPAPAVAVHGFDHLVLRVADTRRSVAWYGGLLGLEVLRLEEWERGEVVFVSVRIGPTTIIDLLEVASDPTVGSLDHLCLVVDPATDLAALAADDRFDVLEGPVGRWGAQGDGTSVYVRDPDGITVELRTY
jgi:catechol 2,3-dioxygenase-like lactoylglutathione lyase family enzyme